MLPLRKIRALLVENEIRQREIARRCGLKPVTVHVVLNGHRKSRRVQRAVADALGMPYESLWGETEEKSA